jgi:predicted RecB family nuclease
VALLDSLGQEGSICVYSGYEARVIRELAEALPELRTDLENLLPRLWDLHPVIKAHYYHPGFQGSYSIKSVLPTLVPALAYSNLEIQGGGMASFQFYRMVFEEVDAVERKRIRDALLQYCERDTLAMVELRRALGS